MVSGFFSERTWKIFKNSRGPKCLGGAKSLEKGCTILVIVETEPMLKDMKDI